MAKLIILQNYPQAERKQIAVDWLVEDPESRVKTVNFDQVAVSLRQGFDVMLVTNALDGFEVEIKNKEEVDK